MSADNHHPFGEANSTVYQSKLAVHERDRYRCVSCGEKFTDDSELDVHHAVPRGQGGPNRLSNLVSGCRRCHEAAHGERDHAPTIRSLSTGDMIKKDFEWFPHFWNNQLPTLSTLAVDYRIEPMFNIAESKSHRAWHIPIGDLRHLDRVLSEMNGVRYESLEY